MILKSLVDAFWALPLFVIGLLPGGPPPAMLADASSKLSDLFEMAAGMGAWIPWSYVAIVAGVVSSVWAVVALIAAVRWVLGWFPTMGGA